MNLKKKIDTIDFEKDAKIPRMDIFYEKVQAFMEWCNEQGIYVNYEKVQITTKSVSHNIGMIAVGQIEANECICKIPKKSLLEANNTVIKDLLRQSSNELKSKSNWSKLIICLMYELSQNSPKWHSYLNLFPNYELLDLPMMWPEEQLEVYFKDSCILANIKSDLENIKEEYESIVMPFIRKHNDKFSEKYYDFDYYKKLVAFVMAYSFMDPSEDPQAKDAVGPVMVPVADILNHVALNNAELQFAENELHIYATKQINKINKVYLQINKNAEFLLNFIFHYTKKFCAWELKFSIISMILFDLLKGDEIYNTYGEHSNQDLLHMYGFVETHPNNIYDNVEIPTSILLTTIKNLHNDIEPVEDEKIKLFQELDLIDENVSIVIDSNGVLNEEEVRQLLQIYSMSRDELVEFYENDYELEDDDDNESLQLTSENLSNLPLDWKNLIKETCKSYFDTLSERLSKIGSLANKNECRQKKVETLIDGHLDILRKMIV